MRLYRQLDAYGYNGWTRLPRCATFYGKHPLPVTLLYTPLRCRTFRYSGCRCYGTAQLGPYGCFISWILHRFTGPQPTPGGSLLYRSPDRITMQHCGTTDRL